MKIYFFDATFQEQIRKIPTRETARWGQWPVGFLLLRAFGFSFGATFISMLIYRGTQANWSRMTGFLDPTRPGYSFFLQEMGLDDGTAETGALLVQIVEAQSGILTYNHAMEVMVLFAFRGIPLTFFMRTKPTPRPVDTAFRNERVHQS